ncbi:MAG: galactose-1-phosphate uridylyltransferase, partial [Dehalococcoidia bacterium]
MSELRWNPLLEEWVVTATHRQERTFLPPKPGGFLTEVPASDFEIVVFENKFPTFRREPPPPAVKVSQLYPVKPARGICEVVLYSPQHEGTLTDKSVEEIYKLVLVWTDRYRELGSLDFVKYVHIFENKGEVIGVTLTHPHGQIYAFPFIPPIIQRELEASRRHHERTGRCLLCDVIGEEVADKCRIIAENISFLAVVPFYARYPYEVHILTKKHRLSLSDLSDEEQWDLARIFKVVMVKYDALFGFSLPYMMNMHQQPTDGRQHDCYHFHIEFYPLHRTRDKLKYRASTESGAGTFITDALPEEWAARLRESGAVD